MLRTYWFLTTRRSTTVLSQIFSLMYSPIVFSFWEARNMKELAVLNFIILIIDEQISGTSAMPQRYTLVYMEEGRIGGGGDFPHVKKERWPIPDWFWDHTNNWGWDALGAMFGSGGQRLGTKHFQLTQFEEVFTSHHWMVRKYKLKRQKNRVRGKGKKLNLVKHQKNSGKLVYNPLPYSLSSGMELKISEEEFLDLKILQLWSLDSKLCVNFLVLSLSFNKLTQTQPSIWW